jgi:hypothetical protein
MTAPVVSLLSASAEVTAIIGSHPMRYYAAGNIPETPTLNANLPCITGQVITGRPLNYLKGPPGMDYVRVQINCWALTLSAAIALFEAARDALIDDGANVQESDNGDTYEADTKRYGYSGDFSFWVQR